MIIIQNFDKKKTTEYRTTFFNITKRNAATQTTSNRTNKGPLSTCGTTKKRQPQLGPHFRDLQSSVKEGTRKIDQTSQNIIAANTNLPQNKPTQHLPGKKPATSTKAKFRLKCKNKCEICEVKYKSSEDKKLSRSFGDQNSWIGSDEGCDYWVHARCVGIFIPLGSDGSDQNFSNETNFENMKEKETSN